VAVRESQLPQSGRRSGPVSARLLVTVASAVTFAWLISASAFPSAAGAQTTPTATTATTTAAQTTPVTTTVVTTTTTPGTKQSGNKQRGNKGTGSEHAKKVGRWSLLIAALGLIVVLPLVLWFVELLVRRRKVTSPVVFGWIRGAIIGADKRVSTSKTVMAVWTYSLASVLLAIVIAKLIGHPQGLNALQDSGLQTEYAVLIGGPLGAAILAKGIVSNQVAGGQSKPQNTDKAKATDLVNNDAGKTDLGDLQYVLFNTVALTFFFGQFLSNPLLGLPDIPNVLVGLTSVSAVGYLGKKALPSLKREIMKVSTRPSPVTTASWNAGQIVKVTALGTGLVNADKSAPTVRVENDTDGDNGSNVVATITDEGTTLEFDLPNALPEGTYALNVVTTEGNKIAKADALTVQPAA
jgi:hypothetical protein